MPTSMPSTPRCGPHATSAEPVQHDSGAGTDARPLVLHVVYRFDTGGLENGIVNLIEHMPAQAYRHAVLALTEVAPHFCQRIRRDDVQYFALHKAPGHGWWLYPAMYRLFGRCARPSCTAATWARWKRSCPLGWPACRCAFMASMVATWPTCSATTAAINGCAAPIDPFVHRYMALSRDLAAYLRDMVSVQPHRIAQVYNGVDTARFRPDPIGRAVIPGCPFVDPSLWLVGTVGRMQAVKHQTLLARAFVRAVQLQPELRQSMRLVMVGDGPLRGECEAILSSNGMASLAWLPGERADVPDVMRGLNCFVLPSLAEGISNTILEAMATGLPVVATEVGGNADLVAHGESGELLPSDQAEAMAHCLLRMAGDRPRAAAMGRHGRGLAEQRFSLAAMVGTYQSLYDRELTMHAPRLLLHR